MIWENFSLWISGGNGKGAQSRALDIQGYSNVIRILLLR